MFDQIKLRLLLRKGESAFITQVLISEIFHLKKQDALEMLKKLEKEGYIEATGIKECWGPAMRGKVLTHQTFERSYTVQSLKKQLALFQERIPIINSCSEYPHLISKVKITSEYPVQARSSGLYLVFSLIRKKISEKEYDKLSWALISKSNKPIYSIFEEVMYPETVIYKQLKTGSHILKLRNVREYELEKIQGAVLFELDSSNRS